MSQSGKEYETLCRKPSNENNVGVNITNFDVKSRVREAVANRVATLYKKFPVTSEEIEKNLGDWTTFFGVV